MVATDIIYVGDDVLQFFDGPGWLKMKTAAWAPQGISAACCVGVLYV